MPQIRALRGPDVLALDPHTVSGSIVVSVMYTIGEFAALGRVSVRMLRHYDAIGLLAPADVDDRTGYRRYAMDQLPLLLRIAELRALQDVAAMAVEHAADGMDDARPVLAGQSQDAVGFLHFEVPPEGGGMRGMGLSHSLVSLVHRTEKWNPFFG